MSILNDDRRFGSDEERAEWQQEMKEEYRRQKAFDILERKRDELSERWEKI